MVQQITRGIKICVRTEYEGSYIQEGNIKYAFAYTIEIENQGKDAVQLVSRFWKIKDSLCDPIIVQGEGVVGEKPILSPGEKYFYSSGCLLTSSIGSMKGHYELLNFTTHRKMKVSIPLFKLSAPFALN